MPGAPGKEGRTVPDAPGKVLCPAFRAWYNRAIVETSTARVHDDTARKAESLMDENPIHKPEELDPEQFVCHARRHMPGHVYKTYDAMMAQAHSALAKAKHVEGTPWVFNGSVRPTLCNWTDSPKSSLEEHITWLENAGWLIRVTPEGKRRRSKDGTILPTEYIILSHAEYVANRGAKDCPPYDYHAKDDSKKGIERGQKKVVAKEKFPKNFALARRAKELGWPHMAKYLKTLDEESRDNIIAHLKKNKPKPVTLTIETEEKP